MATDDAIDSVRDIDLDFTEMSGKLNPLSMRRPGRYSITDVIASFIFSLCMVIHGYPEKTV